jgi:hypothetical protein
MIWRVSNSYLTNTERPTEMKLTPRKNLKKMLFVARGKSDVTPTMPARSATVDTAVKWRHNPRKPFWVLEFHSTKHVTTVQRGFKRNFQKNPPCANSISFLGLSRHFTVISTVALLVAIVGVSSLLPHAINFVMKPLRSCVFTLYFGNRISVTDRDQTVASKVRNRCLMHGEVLERISVWKLQ